MQPENYGVGQSQFQQNFSGVGMAPQLMVFDIEDLGGDADIAGRLLACVPAGYELTVLEAGVSLKATYEGIAGTKQVETGTVVATVSTAGNLAVSVTGFGLSATEAIPVAVALNDDASAVAGKIRAAIAANANVAAVCDVSGETDKVILTAKEFAANDTEANIAWANDDCVGVTEAASSANTTAGAATAVTTIALKNGANTIVSKTISAYPAANTYLSLGTLVAAYQKAVAAANLTLDVTNIGVANPPGMTLQLLVSFDQTFD